MHKERHAEAMATEMREIVRHSQALVEATAGEIDDRIQNIRADLEERLRAVKGKYSELDSRFRDKVRNADELVRDKPYHAMGGTFLAGLILGWFMTRK